jgi:hypothetical protein
MRFAKASEGSDVEDHSFLTSGHTIFSNVETFKPLRFTFGRSSWVPIALKYEWFLNLGKITVLHLIICVQLKFFT